MGFFSRSSNTTSPKEAKPDAKKPEISENAVFVPIEHPVSGSVSQPEVPNDKAVTDEEKEKRYQEVLNHFQNPDLEYPLSSDDKEKKEKLTTVEKAWLTKECFLRYLRACTWKVSDAIDRLENSVVWRREYGISNGVYGKHDPITGKYQIPELAAKALSPETVVDESLTGKQIVFGFDKGCRPCLFLMNGKENTKPSETQVQFLIFMLECVINYMPQGQDKLALCVDFKEYPVGLKSKSVPSVSVGKSVLHILQYHYPERLGRALFVNIPFVASVFLKLCWPFLDPYTKQKVSFDNPFSDFIPTEQLMDEYENGEVEFVFDHDKYWKGLIEIGVKKNQHYLERFLELGATVGLSEVDLRSNEAIPGSDGKTVNYTTEEFQDAISTASVGDNLEKLHISDAPVEKKDPEVVEPVQA
ncbi:hypothetical protein DASC09_049030 [Saccharomycopsis crataegensis]|uniref:CRAL-TRIO domain-containing protein n=1 Tax=Saccharomycopsis crataegensis TaxID=43959 RepID=A0AAV5QRN3_9ASCO|nr:hypothetical protein DASC09_049030 [Saccharomycopsis crataegensis]